LERANNDPWELVTVRLANVSRIRSRYLVDATGRTGSASLRQLSSTIVIDRLIGVGTLFPERCTTPYILIEAVDAGWFYSAALPDGRLAVMYFTDADLYARAGTERKAYFARQLDKAHRTRARVATDPTPENLLILSAATTRRTRVCGRGWIAVGDAALGFDPLSSLGIFKALDSASRASRQVINALDGKTESSSYEDWSTQVFGHYLGHRERYYSRETRWPGSPFWARRQLPETVALKSQRIQTENDMPPPP
jgi:flavin-dependent dehydrogenase